MPIKLSPKELSGMRKAIQQTGFFKGKAEQAKALKSLLKWAKTTPAIGKGLKGAVSIGALSTIGAGVAATAALAYPAKRLGEYLGRRSIEKIPSPKLKSVPTRRKKALTDKERAAVVARIEKRHAKKRRK